MEENTSKVKTYLIILIFLMIIFISGYIVYSKIKTTNNKEEKKEIIKDTVLIDSNLTTELSLNNKDVKKLYNYVNNKNIDYASYKNRGKKLSWDYLSLVTMYNIPQNYVLKDEKNIEYVDSYSFLDKYREIFGSDLTISKEEQNTTTCGAVNYKNDVYYPNWYCKEKSDDSIIVTYLKNVTIDKEYLNINKYYAFIVKTDENTFDLYSSDEKEEKTLIATNLSIYEISNYINEMNIMSYRFKKINNQYYLNNIK
ncbi:MAG: hypothetical protein SPI91_02255 [Bacilli bacterium]|mgnify:FL=1|nr:hypothetical protein [Bacilli bacterium]